MTEPAEYTFNIRNIEVNLHNRLSGTSLANILQECASRHAATLGVSTLDLMRAGHTWVLSKLKISLNDTARLGDQLTVHTWPAGAHGVRAFRGFKIFNNEKQQIGTAESIWLILDLSQRKVIPIPHEVGLLQLEEDTLRYKFRKTIPQVQSAEYKYQSTVGWHDLDINRHVNNNHYLRWIVESFPFDFLNTHTMATAELVFLGESHYGDGIFVHTCREGDNTFIHEVRNQERAILMRAVTGWATA